MPSRPNHAPPKARSRDACDAPSPPRHAVVALSAIVEWYFATYYGVLDGPGCLPFYCDPSQVGAFAISPSELCAGTDAAIMRLAIGFTMFQARRDIDVMAIQAAMPPELVARLTDPGALRTALSRLPCSIEPAFSGLHGDCDVKRVAAGGADCSRCPGQPCPVKEASQAFKRYGDFGKVPLSFAVLAATTPSTTMAGLYTAALEAQTDPTARAIWLEAEVCRAWRTDKKIANFILSALTNPDLTPGLHPWLDGVDWRWFVVVDRHVARALVALGAPEKASYEDHRRWLFALAARIDLRQYAPAAHANNPRLIQQALYRFGSVANRRAHPADCCHRDEQTCSTCPKVLRSACPLARI